LLRTYCDVHVLIADVDGWPEGTFGLPMPKTGCPVGAVVDWETGMSNLKPVFLVSFVLFTVCIQGVLTTR